MPWLYLTLAIVGEVIGTTALKASDGFTRLGPSLLVVLGYAIAFYLLAQVLRTIPLGITYAIWSGAGVAAVTIIGWLIYGQRLDGPAILGIGLIVAGVLVLNLWSGAAH
ncbi:DMT family transporter [Roseicyclus mahoneyensis]|uniref:Small multidrug resistance pump n=1 Tax=Roseicyclus mahoneyensis TaxID=164332 RepID=A0A316GEY1_9RHOB|nr:SMR family transporter [Roseicyclus mahoneyensis]PWK59563.1 small multidrug resistance pump [Roseicyclus mahoneyensis]